MVEADSKAVLETCKNVVVTYLGVQMPCLWVEG